jgi:hypothetical protein
MKSIVRAAALSACGVFLLAACDPEEDARQAVEGKLAQRVEEATGEKTVVELTDKGGVVTSGRDRIAVATGEEGRHVVAPPLPVPDGVRRTGAIPGVREDVVYLAASGVDLATFADRYQETAGKAGFSPTGRTLSDGMLSLSFTATDARTLHLYAYREGNEVLATLVAARGR